MSAGTNLMLVDSTSTHLAQLGALSSNGRSKTFDASADGYGRGEACIVFVARRPAGGQAALAVMHGEKWLYRAIREGLGGSCAALFASDSRFCRPKLAAGSAYNQDGRSSGLTAPNGPAQSMLVRTALQVAGALPHHVGLVSMHGTGTPLGDPIEVNALGQALAAPVPRPVTLCESSAAGARQRCSVFTYRICFDHARMHPSPCAASAKACFGHTEGTAGIHGAMIAVLALQQHAAPPIMHSRSLNPYVASGFDEWRSSQQNVLPLVAKEVAAWPSAPRVLAGCSSFGMSGVNAHGLFSAPNTQDHAEPRLAWQRQRHWPVPPYHHMLVAALWDRARATARRASARPGSAFSMPGANGPSIWTALHLSTPTFLPAPFNRPAACRLQCSLVAADLAYLYDHLVQDTSILPGAGMLEISTAR